MGPYFGWGRPFPMPRETVRGMTIAFAIVAATVLVAALLR